MSPEAQRWEELHRGRSAVFVTRHFMRSISQEGRMMELDAWQRLVGPRWCTECERLVPKDEVRDDGQLWHVKCGGLTEVQNG